MSKLRAACWLAGHSDRRCAGEHSGRYEKVHSAWADEEIEVHTWDVFGHGKSEPFDASDRAYVPDYNHLVHPCV